MKRKCWRHNSIFWFVIYLIYHLYLYSFKVKRDGFDDSLDLQETADSQFVKNNSSSLARSKLQYLWKMKRSRINKTELVIEQEHMKYARRTRRFQRMFN